MLNSRCRTTQKTNMRTSRILCTSFGHVGGDRPGGGGRGGTCEELIDVWHITNRDVTIWSSREINCKVDPLTIVVARAAAPRDFSRREGSVASAELRKRYRRAEQPAAGAAHVTR